jgi:hypothetical protein
VETVIRTFSVAPYFSEDEEVRQSLDFDPIGRLGGVLYPNGYGFRFAFIPDSKTSCDPINFELRIQCLRNYWADYVAESDILSKGVFDRKGFTESRLRWSVWRRFSRAISEFYDRVTQLEMIRKKLYTEWIENVDTKFIDSMFCAKLDYSDGNALFSSMINSSSIFFDMMSGLDSLVRKVRPSRRIRECHFVYDGLMYPYKGYGRYDFVFCGFSNAPGFLYKNDQEALTHFFRMCLDSDPVRAARVLYSMRLDIQSLRAGNLPPFFVG